MKLLLDQCVATALVERMEASGVQAIHTSSIGLDRASDAEILEFAAGNSLVIVTHDADFHTILAIQRAHGPSVIRLRYDDYLVTDVERQLRFIVDQFGEELIDGAIVTCRGQSIAMRKLPI